MSRAYRITLKNSQTRVLSAQDEISTTLEILEILSGEEMAELLRKELTARGFQPAEDGSMARREGPLAIRIDPCTGKVTVKMEGSQEVQVEAQKEVIGFDDIGPSARELHQQAEQLLKESFDQKFDAEEEKLQRQLTGELERRLNDIQPEISQIVNKVTREALKRKAERMGQVREIHENEETGELTIKLEV